MAALPNSAAQTVDLDGAAVGSLVAYIERRSQRVTHDPKQADLVVRRLRHHLEEWHERRKRLSSGVLGYQEGADVTGLLHPPEEGAWDRWSVPRSLREVEPEVLLQLQRTDRSVDEPPPWRYAEADGADR